MLDLVLVIVLGVSDLLRPSGATATPPFVEEDVGGEAEELPGEGEESWGTGPLWV